MTTTFFARPSSMCSAETVAPAMYGSPTLVSLPSSVKSTLSNVILPSFAVRSFSTFKTLSCVTRYCFPPVSIIAIFTISRQTITRPSIKRNTQKKKAGLPHERPAIPKPLTSGECDCLIPVLREGDGAPPQPKQLLRGYFAVADGKTLPHGRPAIFFARVIHEHIRSLLTANNEPMQ